MLIELIEEMRKQIIQKEEESRLSAEKTPLAAYETEEAVRGIQIKEAAHGKRD